MSKNKKLILGLVLVGLVFLLTPSFALADTYNCLCEGTSGYMQNPNAKTSAACDTYGKSINKNVANCTFSVIKSASKSAAKAPPLINPLGVSDVNVLIGRVIKGVLGIVGAIALLMFIYGGFMWLTSAGSEQRITKGKQVLVWATIGLAVIFFSYSILGLVLDALTGKTTSGTPQSISQGCCEYTQGNGKVVCFNTSSKKGCEAQPGQKFNAGKVCASANNINYCQ